MNKDNIPFEFRILSSINFMLLELIRMLFDKGVLTIEDYRKLVKIDKEWMEKK